LYKNLYKPTEKIRNRRPKHAGHCIRHPDSIANLDLLWIPKVGKRMQGRPKTKFTDTLKRDTGIKDLEILRKTMHDREIWK